MESNQFDISDSYFDETRVSLKNEAFRLTPAKRCYFKCQTGEVR